MQDTVQYFRAPDVPGLVLSDGHFSTFSFDRHFHLSYHISLVVDGVQRQSASGKTYLVGPGRLSVIPPDEMHDGSGYEKCEYTLKTFRIPPNVFTEEMANAMDSAHCVEFGSNVLDDKPLWDRACLLHYVLQRGDASSLFVEEQWMDLVKRLLFHSEIHLVDEPEGALAKPHWKEVRDYCHDNLSEKISLEQLAVLCNLNRYQFLRRFKSTVGVTPYNWLKQLRLEQACTLLSKGERVSTVAASVGFYDQSHFVHAFRKAYGVPPSKY
ncbi:AraC family transcriptional regulator [Halodesulfovibrio aestuarii]|uniref:Transcriptional regulator, AraC family n=1 Tax=Halodesulfovibrio aestuarii TaxID=126333 RepID=A0A8G2CAI3_9BACT|nr:AraC family transcriptional regulator [Halodesulfovibrio aestuarii]SHJ31301.1 transcriptional regulator, AraC family [Halodesulfovibrio aestuarii]